MNDEPKLSLNIRLEPSLRRRLEAVAEADRRPVGSLIRNVLHDYIDRQRQPEVAA
jgi:predicted transcriptional regulator